MIDITKMQAYESPVPPALYPQLACVLLAVGLFLAAWFFIFEVTGTNKTRSLFKELTGASLAALFLGFGTLFMMLWVGIYV